MTTTPPISIDDIHSLSLDAIETIHLPSLSITETGAVLQRVNQLLALLATQSTAPPSDRSETSICEPSSLSLLNNNIDHPYAQPSAFDLSGSWNYGRYSGNGLGTDPNGSECAAIIASIYHSNRAIRPNYPHSPHSYADDFASPVEQHPSLNTQVLIDSVLAELPSPKHSLHSRLALYIAQSKLDTISDRIALTDVYLRAQKKWRSRTAKLDADKIRKYSNAFTTDHSHSSSFASHDDSLASNSHSNSSSHHVDTASFSRPRGSGTAIRGLPHVFSPNAGAGISSSHLLGLDIIPSAGAPSSRRGGIMNGSSTGSLSSINPLARSSLTKDRSNGGGLMADGLLYARSEEDVARMIQVIEDSREDRIHRLSATIPDLIVDMPTYRTRVTRLAANGYPPSDIQHTIRDEYGSALDSLPKIPGAVRISDPIQYYSDVGLARGWLPCEEARFFRAYLEHAKDFHKIATDVGTRNEGQCVQWYYANKHRLQLKRELKRFRRLRSSVGGSAAAFNFAASVTSPRTCTHHGLQSPVLSPAMVTHGSAPKPTSSRWTGSETGAIRQAVAQYGKDNISVIATHVQSKTVEQCKNWLHNHKDVVSRILRDEERKHARLSRMNGAFAHGDRRHEFEDDGFEVPMEPDVTREPTPVDLVVPSSPALAQPVQEPKPDKKRKRKRDPDSSNLVDSGRRRKSKLDTDGVFSADATPPSSTNDNHVAAIASSQDHVGEEAVLSCGDLVPPIHPVVSATAAVSGHPSTLSSASTSTVKLSSHWRPSDKARFAELHACYGNDWEQIAKEMGTKSATQVQRYERRQRQAQVAGTASSKLPGVNEKAVSVGPAPDSEDDPGSGGDAKLLQNDSTPMSPVKPSAVVSATDQCTPEKQQYIRKNHHGMLHVCSPSPMHSRRRTASQPLPRTGYGIMTNSQLPPSMDYVSTYNTGLSGVVPYSFPHRMQTPVSYGLALPVSTCMSPRGLIFQTPQYLGKPSADTSSTQSVPSSTVGTVVPPVLPSSFPSKYPFPPFPYYYPSTGATSSSYANFRPPPPLYPSIQRSVMFPPYHHGHLAAAVHHLPTVAAVAQVNAEYPPYSVTSSSGLRLTPPALVECVAPDIAHSSTKSPKTALDTFLPAQSHSTSCFDHSVSPEAIPSLSPALFADISLGSTGDVVVTPAGATNGNEPCIVPSNIIGNLMQSSQTIATTASFTCSDTPSDKLQSPV